MQLSGITVSALADEFGLSADEMLDFCEMFDVDAPDAQSMLSNDGVAILRGVVNGEIDPAAPLPEDEAEGSGFLSGTFAAPAEVVFPVDAESLDTKPQPSTVEEAEPRRRFQPPAAPAGRQRRAAGEEVPDVATTSWWGRRFRGGYKFDGYVPRWLRFVYVLSVVALLGVLWFVFVGSDSKDQASSALFPSAPDLAIGSCFQADAGLWLDTAVVVPCAGPHDAQSVTVIELTPASRPYPDLSDLRSESVVLCADRIREQITLTDGLAIAVSVPSATEWRGGDQRVLCSVVHQLGESLFGSVL